nr:PREDICTED: sperm acrosome membrane-associated protein 3 [Equus przewalskii]
MRADEATDALPSVSGRPGPLGCLPSQNPALSLSAGGSTSAACMDARGWPPGRWLCPPGIVLLAFASLLSCLLPSGQAKIYSRCELTRTLRNFGLEGYRGYSLADWVCLAYYTSTGKGVGWASDGALDQIAGELEQITLYFHGEAWRHHCQGKDLRDWVDGCDF